MADPHDPVGVAKPTGWFWWLGGRAGRREYWLYAALLFALGVILSHAPPVIDLAASIMMILVMVRRAHDLGRTGWWGVAAALAPIPPVVILFYLSGENVALAVGYGLSIVLTIILGALPGDAGDNRFGPPPPFTARRVLTGR